MSQKEDRVESSTVRLMVIVLLRHGFFLYLYGDQGFQ